MNEKIKNWQDVTIDELNSHWDMGFDELPNPMTFECAQYMNAYSYGDIAGEGIDVRCEHANEVVGVFKNNVMANDIENELGKLGWKLRRFDMCLVMWKDNEEVYFDINEGNEVGYMTLYLLDVNKCKSSKVEDYYDDVRECEVLDKNIVITPKNIVGVFQDVCKKYIDLTEDAGAGMRNYNLVVDGVEMIVQVYPNDEFHNVWFLYNDNYEVVGDLVFAVAVKRLVAYYNSLKGLSEIKKTKSVDYSDAESAFVEFCESKNAVPFRRDIGKGVHEIVYCTNKGVVYHYIDDEGYPKMRSFGYSLPSEISNNGILEYIVRYLVDCEDYGNIMKLMNFMKLSNDEKNEVGVPYEELYGLIWEDGSWDKFADIKNLRIDSQQLKKDCEYLKSIYDYLKFGKYVDSLGDIHDDVETHEMFNSADDFCEYFKKSGKTLREFLLEYDDLSRKDSLWSKCCEYAGNLVDVYIGGETDVKSCISNQLATRMYDFMMENDVTHFPKK